jgi:hypothetical protein
MTNKSQALNLDTIEDNAPIYVRNMTKTDFNFRLISGNDTVIVTIPRTFIPMDLRQWAKTDMVKNSSEIRHALRTGVLKLLTEKEALSILETKEGSRENELVRKKLNLVTDDLRYEDSDLAALNISAVGDMDEIEPKIRECLADDDMGCSDKLAIIVALDKEEPLTQFTLEWIKSTCPETCGELLEYVETRLESFKNSGLRSITRK